MIIELTEDQEINGKIRPKGKIMQVTKEKAATLKCKALTKDGHSDSSANNKEIFTKAKKNESKIKTVLEKSERESVQDGNDNEHIG